jgi:hypothetical protein
MLKQLVSALRRDKEKLDYGKFKDILALCKKTSTSELIREALQVYKRVADRDPTKREYEYFYG